MTSPRRDFDRIATAWLDLMPSEVPERVVESVLQAVEVTPQVRRGPHGRSFASPMLNRLILLGAAMALGAALLGGAILVAGSRSGPTLNPPTIATPAPASPSGGLGGSPSPDPSPAPGALRANWIADATTGTVFGELDEPIGFNVNGPGTAAWITNPAGNSVFVSTPTDVGGNEISVALDRDEWGCAAGADGRYRWSVTPDDRYLTIATIRDTCPARADALARTWTRTHVGASRGGTAVLTGLGPLVQVTLPEGSYTTRPMTDVHEVMDVGQDFSFLAFRDPQAFADPCAKTLQPFSPGARAFIDALRRNPAMGDFVEEPLEVGGYPAIHLTLLALPDHPRCDPDHPFYQWTPRGDPGGHWWLTGGDADSMYVVDHPDATLLFQVLPIGTEREAEVISSITFPPSLAPAP